MFSDNPNNPFVFNELYFANVTSQRYKDTAQAFWYRLNIVLAGSLGLFTTSMVIFLILKNTPKQFKPYSQMLMLAAAADLYHLFGDIWTQTRLKIVNGTMLFSFIGPVSYFPYFIQCHSLTISASAQVLSYLVLPIAYHYRFYTIRKKHPPEIGQIFTYILICILLSSICGFNAARSYCTFDNPDNFDYAQWWSPEIPVPNLIIGPKGYYYMLIHGYYLSFITILSYSAIIFFALLTVYELKKQAKLLSNKTLSLQSQFEKTLMSQALLPLIFGVIPILSAQIARMSNITVENIGDYIAILLAWYPFLNSSSTLLFIVPYRTYCLRKLNILNYTRKPTGMASQSSGIVAIDRSTQHTTLAPSPTLPRPRVPIPM